MKRTIREAYEVYKQITCEYEDLDLIPEIFTDDVVGGNASYGRIRGLEAQTIFLTTAQKMGLVPEDHLWCMIDGNNLAFRARVWGKARNQAPFVDAIGHLIFDPGRAKFCFYYGFYDSQAMATMLSSVSTGAVDAATEGFRAVQVATKGFESRPGFDPELQDLMRVSHTG